jgi:hypothetical protein
LFADDLIIFAKATSSEATSITSCLHKYCSWSGQKVNNGKSFILFSKNTSPASISSILGIIPYRLTTFTPFYLGLPLLFGSSRKMAFQPLIDKVLSKITGWRAKTLSQAGMIVLIKSTAVAIPTYAMSTFLLPSSLCKTLDRHFKDFWWGFPLDKSSHLSLKSWDSICLPRNQGGLGLRKMFTSNLALILLHSNENFFIPILYGFSTCIKKYLHYGSFFSGPSSPTASWLWRGIQKCKQYLVSSSCLKITTTSFEPIWPTAKVPSLPSYRPSPRNPNGRNVPSLSISDLILPGTRQWNEHLLYGIFEFSSAYAISRLPISQEVDSSYLWTPSCSGTSLISPSSLWKNIWKLQLTDRFRLFLWKIAWDILPTTTRLQTIIPTYRPNT